MPLNVNQQNTYLQLSPRLQFVLPQITPNRDYKVTIKQNNFIDNWGFGIDGAQKWGGEPAPEEQLFQIGYKTWLEPSAYQMSNGRKFKLLSGSVKDYQMQVLDIGPDM